MRHHSQTTTPVQKALEQARSLLAEQRFAEAQTAFEQLIARYPRQHQANMMPAYLGLADCCLALGSADEATTVLRRAARKWPRNAEVLSHLARAYAEKGEARMALTHARRALTANPQCAHALKVMADVHLRQGKHEEAIAACVEALRINPKWDTVHDTLAEALVARQRLEEAVTILHAACDLSPRHHARYLKLADLYCRLERWTEAENTLRAALSVVDNPSRIHHALAELCYTMRDYERAIAEGDATLQLHASNLSVIDLLASAHLQQSDVSGAIEVISRAVALMPMDPVNRFKLAALYHQKGDVARAAQEYQRLITLHPQGIWAHDAQDALQALDRYQMHQIFALAAENFVFRVKLKRDIKPTLREYGFYLTESALNTLENMDFDDMLDYESQGDMRYH
jgi:tetratricopeptide (TPR) repeat protein